MVHATAYDANKNLYLTKNELTQAAKEWVEIETPIADLEPVDDVVEPVVSAAAEETPADDESEDDHVVTIDELPTPTPPPIAEPAHIEAVHEPEFEARRSCVAGRGARIGASERVRKAAEPVREEAERQAQAAEAQLLSLLDDESESSKQAEEKARKKREKRKRQQEKKAREKQQQIEEEKEAAEAARRQSEAQRPWSAPCAAAREAKPEPEQEA